MSEADEYGPGGDRESGPQSEDAIRDESAACKHPGDPGEYVVELLVFVEADAATDAEALGERAAREAMRAVTPRSAGRAKVLNVVVADVRRSE
jgi:hypothetical protein